MRQLPIPRPSHIVGTIESSVGIGKQHSQQVQNATNTTLPRGWETAASACDEKVSGVPPVLARVTCVWGKTSFPAGRLLYPTS